MLRHPRFAGVRSDYDRVLKQRNALLKSAGAGGARSRSTCAPSRCGTRTSPPSVAELLAARLDLVDALRPLVDKAYQSVAESGFASSGPATMDYRSSLFEPRRPERGTSGEGSRAARRRPAGGGPGAAGRRDARADGDRARRPSSTAASRWSARTATSWCSSSARCRRRATPATASRGRSRWRSAGVVRPAARRVRRRAASRCWSSTTCSPSSTTTAASRLAAMVAGAEQVLVTAAVPGDVPEAAGRRPGRRHGRRGPAGAMSR